MGLATTARSRHRQSPSVLLRSVEGKADAGGSEQREGVTWAVFSYVFQWYIVSFCAVVLNKQLLSPGGAADAEVTPFALALVQSLSAVGYGSLAVLASARGRARARALDRSSSSAAASAPLWRTFLWLGMLRLSVIILGLVSLQHVAASFTETIKAASPFFTVIAAWWMTGERTPPTHLFALFFVVGGLVVASCAELSFVWIGFLAAVFTTVFECVQNVSCKNLLQPGMYTPAELQLYIAAVACVVQLAWLAYKCFRGTFVFPTQAAAVGLVLFAGFVYWLQSALAFKIISHVSAVQLSVFNTSKRAMIIFLSTLYFGNIVTLRGWMGTFVTLGGSFAYTWIKTQSTAVAAATSPSPSRGMPRSALPRASWSRPWPSVWLLPATDVIRAGA